MQRKSQLAAEISRVIQERCSALQAVRRYTSSSTETVISFIPQTSQLAREPTLEPCRGTGNLRDD